MEREGAKAREDREDGALNTEEDGVKNEWRVYSPLPCADNENGHGRMTSSRQTVKIIAASAALLGAPACILASPVSVTVRVTTAAGDPIPDAPIEVYSDIDVGFGFTDASGTCEFALGLDSTETELVARLWNGYRHLTLTPEERDLADLRYEELLAAYYISPFYLFEANEGQSDYQVEIVAKPAVKATGRLVDEEGAPIADDVLVMAVRGGAWFGIFTDSNGEFEVHGIERGVTGEIQIGIEGPEMKFIALSAAQAARDFGLGDVIIKRHERPVPLEMPVINAADLVEPSGVTLEYQVTLIRNDGLVVLTFPVDPSVAMAVAEEVAVQTDVPRTTNGTYYVTPGPVNSATGQALLDAVRAGQLAQLDAAGVPKLTAVVGETTQFTLDARQARDAIRTATSQTP